MKSKIRFSSILGVAAGFWVVWFGVISHTPRPEIFYDQHALILVMGGTLAAALLAFPFRHFRDVAAFISAGAFFPMERNYVSTAENILRLSGRRADRALDPHVAIGFHPFLLEGYNLMKKQPWTTAELKMLLQGRMNGFKERYAQDARMLAALAKFPPAFGLLGATSGMIAMMSNLSPEAKDSIGPAMASALVATFWGIALANLILLPLSDHAIRCNVDDARLRMMIASGLLLLHQEVPPGVLYEHLIGFLPMSLRSHESLTNALSSAEGHLRLAESREAAQ